MLAVSRTNRGLVRKNNEDSVLVRIPDLFAIADGMGGSEAGEIASLEAVKRLQKITLDKKTEEKILPSLQAKIEKINGQIWKMAQEQPDKKGMGTTLTAVYIRGEKAFVAHVGDSRIYLLQDGNLKQMSSDHSYVAELVRQKQLTPREAEESNQKHMILRAVGAEPEVQVDVFEFLLTGVQKLLLCSDGLSNMVSKEKIQEILKGQDLDKMADALMDTALTAGGEDNISFIIIALEENHE